MADTDLSAGELTAEERTLSNLGLEEQGHRIGLQKSVFRFALVAAGILLLVAVMLALFSMYLYATLDRFNWHVVLLVGAFLVPMTVILVAALRAAFPKREPEKAEADLPSWDVVKDFFKELVGAVKTN